MGRKAISTDDIELSTECVVTRLLSLHFTVHLKILHLHSQTNKKAVHYK